MQQTGLLHLHPPGVSGMMVVMAEQVQCPMDNKVSQMMGHTPFRGNRLSPNDAKRQNQFGGGVFVGQHIGRLVATPMTGIEPLDQAVAGEHHCDFGRHRRGTRPTRHPRRPRHHRIRGWHEAAPGRIQHDYSGLRLSLHVRGERPRCGSIIPVPGVRRVIAL